MAVSGEADGAGEGAADGIDAWLRSGGLVVTASDRAARALGASFHRARQAEGLSAWPAPKILDWKSFVRTAWEERDKKDGGDGRLLLNSTQERSIWTDLAAADRRLATLLEGPRHRLATLAMEAHELLAAHAPRYLKDTARAAWQQDAAAFSNWLSAFDRTCRAGNLLSTARLPLELIPLLEDDRLEDDHLERPPLLLAGFDRILPVQRAVFDAWGAWRESAPGRPAARTLFHQAPDAQAELAACALWCGGRLAANPRIRLLVITRNAGPSRGQIERAFLKHAGSDDAPLFEFSLGIPLSQVALPKAAQFLLRWLSGPLQENELDWLFSSGHAAGPQQSSQLQAQMRALRRRGLEQPQWTLNAFLGSASPGNVPAQLPADWVARITRAQRSLAEFARQPQNPLDWAELVPRLLETAGWPGPHPLSSAEFQAVRRWRQAVETVGSLGFDGRRILWTDFLSILARALDETLFAPESQDAPIQIAGPAESAGLTADAIWFLGANEDAWPASGITHPLLPLDVQRQAGMPHASPQLDWDLAHAITTRLIASAPEIHFSYAKQTEAAETRPSRLIAQFAGTAQQLPQAPGNPEPRTVLFQDVSRVPFPPGKVQGGSSVLTFQSQCPFKAFAAARLSAQGWNPAEAGLTPSQRGQLLHAVLQAIWSGPPDGIRSQRELQDLKAGVVAEQVHRVFQRVFQHDLPFGLRQRMPRRYLELEEQRLTGLIREWLAYESTRIGFEVEETEAARTITLAGLTLKLRLDRIDRLNDGSLLVIDYKTGEVYPKSWELPRPDDVQLPLYAGFALDGDLGGLVFAKVRTGDLGFAGQVGDPAATLFTDLKSNSALVKNALTAEQLIDWREHIEQLAMDFVAGRAEVDPRDAPKTCERCGLQTLCRIHENESRAGLEAEDDSDGPDAAHELAYE